MVRLVFLDIDGVLNSRQFILSVQEKFDNPAHQIDPEAIVRLNRLTDATGAFLVITSTWRYPFVNHERLIYPEKLKALFAGHGLTAPIVGATPQTVGSELRGDQIQTWLDNHMIDRVSSFIILDDDSDMGDLTPRLIRTTFDAGLQDSHVARGITMLVGDST